MSQLNRRAFLRAGGCAVVGSVTVAGRAAGDHLDNQPAHVTLEYDRETLKTYQPKLVSEHLDVSPNAMYGWVARSPEHSTSVAVYWTEYDKQEGVSPFDGSLSDSHDEDHEPVYVEFSESDGSVREVVFSAYHWLAGRGRPPGIPLAEETHPMLHAVKPWHQYRTTTTEGNRPPINDLTDVYTDWLDGGLEQDLEPGVVVNPWRMLGASGRSHWWQETAAGWSFDAAFVRNLYRMSKLPGIDIGGASESELET